MDAASATSDHLDPCDASSLREHRASFGSDIRLRTLFPGKFETHRFIVQSGRWVGQRLVVFSRTAQKLVILWDFSAIDFSFPGLPIFLISHGSEVLHLEIAFSVFFGIIKPACSADQVWDVQQWDFPGIPILPLPLIVQFFGIFPVQDPHVDSRPSSQLFGRTFSHFHGSLHFLEGILEVKVEMGDEHFDFRLQVISAQPSLGSKVPEGTPSLDLHQLGVIGYSVQDA